MSLQSTTGDCCDRADRYAEFAIWLKDHLTISLFLHFSVGEKTKSTKWVDFC